MFKKIILIIASLLLFAGCAHKKVVKPDNNQTIALPEPIVEAEVELEIEPVYDQFDCQQNDEMIMGESAAKIVVIKSKRVLVLFDNEGNVLSRHRISLGKNSVGTKLKQGDYKTPEGTYTITRKGNDHKYYKEIFISYPNHEDRRRSQSLGFNPGGGISIHAQVPWNWDGRRNDYTLGKDWTQGCMAVTNEGMDMIWDRIAIGTPIEIRE